MLRINWGILVAVAWLALLPNVSALAVPSDVDLDLQMEKEFTPLQADAEAQFVSEPVNAEQEFSALPVDAEKEFAPLQPDAEQEFSPAA